MPSQARLVPGRPLGGSELPGARIPGDEGHGRRLLTAIDALDELPALTESRTRLVSLLREPKPSRGKIVAAVESDPAMAVAVLRAPRRSHAGTRDIGSVPAAIEALTPAELQTTVSGVPVTDFFERSDVWDSAPERFRVHAVTVHHLAERLAIEVGQARRDELLAAALLHDIGKLALTYAYADYPERIHGDAGNPEERVEREREHLGVDHAAVGGLLARRWSLSGGLAATISRHHDDEISGAAAIVRLADLLAHHASGSPIDHRRLARTARLAGLTEHRLRELLYHLPNLGRGERRGREPSPLSARETEVLRLLAKGQRYKVIAGGLGTSPSTVRTHINNIYRKMGVVDRAQAVLVATERGWI